MTDIVQEVVVQAVTPSTVIVEALGTTTIDVSANTTLGAPGPAGPAGADGSDGAQGPAGPVGPAGADGADATLSDDDPEDLGSTDSGTSEEASRSDHVHALPSAADVGADTAGTATAAISAHTASSDPHGDRAYADGLVDDLSGVSDAATSRANLGLGTAATTSATDYATAAQGATADAALPASYLDTDGTLAANSDSKVPSQRAVKAYADDRAGAGVVMSHDWRLIPDGAVDASIDSNGEGQETVEWSDVNDTYPAAAQEAQVVDGALRCRSTTPASVVGVFGANTAISHYATATDVRAGFLHAGYLDAEVESECDGHASINIVLVDGTGTGYVCHFYTVYEEDSSGLLESKVVIGRDISGVLTEDDETVLSALLKAGDVCEFRVQAGSPNTLTAYVNGQVVATHTDSNLDLTDAEVFSLPITTQATGQKWRPGVYAQWLTTGRAWVPSLVGYNHVHAVPSAADVGADAAGTAAALVDDLSGVSDAATARSNLGLGTAATAALLDQDDMSSNSATSVPSQQSVKAYVDNEVASASGGGVSMAWPTASTYDVPLIPQGTHASAAAAALSAGYLVLYGFGAVQEQTFSEIGVNVTASNLTAGQSVHVGLWEALSNGNIGNVLESVQIVVGTSTGYIYTTGLTFDLPAKGYIGVLNPLGNAGSVTVGRQYVSWGNTIVNAANVPYAHLKTGVASIADLTGETLTGAWSSGPQVFCVI